MWFKKPELSESEKLQKFRAEVLTRIDTLAADRWRDVITTQHNVPVITEYHATTANGAEVIVEFHNPASYGYDSTRTYKLTVDGETIAEYQISGYSDYHGDKDVAALYHNVDKRVKDWRAEKNKPEREAQDAKRRREAEKSAIDEEKKRRDTLRRL